jgi:hypothetical protein
VVSELGREDKVLHAVVNPDEEAYFNVISALSNCKSGSIKQVRIRVTYV